MKINLMDRFLLYIRTSSSIHVIYTTDNESEAEDIHRRSVLNPDFFDVEIYDRLYENWLDDQINERINGRIQF